MLKGLCVWFCHLKLQEELVFIHVYVPRVYLHRTENTFSFIKCQLNGDQLPHYGFLSFLILHSDFSNSQMACFLKATS